MLHFSSADACLQHIFWFCHPKSQMHGFPQLHTCHPRCFGAVFTLLHYLQLLLVLVKAMRVPRLLHAQFLTIFAAACQWTTSTPRAVFCLQGLSMICCSLVQLGAQHTPLMDGIADRLMDIIERRLTRRGRFRDDSLTPQTLAHTAYAYSR